MKKLLLLFSVALLSTATASAQSSRLKSITSSDDYIHFEYTYDDKGRFSKVYREDFGGTTYNDTLCYNAKSQIESDITYQYFEDDDKFKLVSKCCYGYDDNGNVAWRDNYNSFGGSELSQSAHITYDYDADNHMIKQSQYWSFDLDNMCLPLRNMPISTTRPLLKSLARRNIHTTIWGSLSMSNTIVSIKARPH